jgi:hypothetical protein
VASARPVTWIHRKPGGPGNIFGVWETFDTWTQVEGVVSTVPLSRCITWSVWTCPQMTHRTSGYALRTRISSSPLCNCVASI